MKTVLRSIAAILAGFVVASIVMMIVETINGNILYPELGKIAAGMTDREQIRALIASAPIGALLVVIVGWILGSFAGGLIAALIAARSTLTHAIVLGVLLTCAGVANNLMIPPPMWFWIVSLFVFVPPAYLGGMLAPKR